MNDNSVIITFIICVAVLTVLCAGSPDLLDAIISAVGK